MLLILMYLPVSTKLINHKAHLIYVEVNHALAFVGHEGSEVQSDDHVPGTAKLFVESQLQELRQVLEVLLLLLGPQL